MTEAARPKRREFLGALAAGAVAIGLGSPVPRAFAGETRHNGDVTPSDKWLSAITGKHRQIFDTPNHENGWGLLHVRNYLNTMRDTYHATTPDVTAVVTIYGLGTMLAFNDDMWKKYGLGAASKVMAPDDTLEALAASGADNVHPLVVFVVQLIQYGDREIAFDHLAEISRSR